MTVHELKCEIAYFCAIYDGRKTFDVRFDDRGFAEGDELLLREWLNYPPAFAGRWLRARVPYIYRGGVPRQMLTADPTSEETYRDEPRPVIPLVGWSAYGHVDDREVVIMALEIIERSGPVATKIEQAAELVGARA